MNSQITFTAYTRIMTNHFHRFHNNIAHFMAPSTFLSWWFSWASNMKIDFRVPCTLCKHEPKQLACDGTKIGILFKNLEVTPIEHPTSDVHVAAGHRRNDRAFVSFQTGALDKDKKHLAREFLLDACYKVTGKDVKEFAESSETLRDILLSSIPDECHELIIDFLSGVFPQPVTQCLARFLSLLASDRPLTSIVPFRFAASLEGLCHKLVVGEQADISQVRAFSPELFYSFLKAKEYNLLEQMAQFVLGLINKLRQTHENDHQTPHPDPIPGTYNPERFGRAYYFTSTGEQVRNMPMYDINSKCSSANYDDPPSSESCQKKYPEVSRKGTAYLFLWFDPNHYGHCYGYHIIPSSEGRKDPFASCFLHMANPPDEIFYDFACQLEEYCLNREPQFFLKTRFWHDIFHGYSHKCPPVYRSNRIQSLNHLNTEICEQFNSFIQRIKHSARSMSASRFSFFLQFMIHQWNERKRMKFEQQCKVAAQFLQ